MITLIKVFKYALTGLAALLLLVALALTGILARAKLSVQSDDELHLTNKRAYLNELSTLPAPEKARAPNVVLILFDDLGYGDLGFNGNTAIKTPAMDELARSGVRMNNYYAPSSVCSPSRAGLLTGRLPLRAGVPQVLFPKGSALELTITARGGNVRMPAEEITMAEVLKASGYRTGLVGKWHLGDVQPSLPNNFGFDFFYGSLYSNDLEPFAIYRNQTVEHPAPADQTKLNDWYTAEASGFIRHASKAPFFLYFAHNFPHQPLFVSPANQGRSKAGRYGDVVETIDDSVAAVVAALKAMGEFDNTLILITSDNGPWFQGSQGGFRGRKGSTFDGGMRMPMVVHWPAGIPGGRVIDGIAMGTDWMPTIMDIVGIPVPNDRIIDGVSLKTLITKGGESPHDYLYFFAGKDLRAVRDQRFKYHAANKWIYAPEPSNFGFSLARSSWLFDTSVDHDESYDTSELHEPQVKRMQAAFMRKAQALKNNPRGWK